MSRLHFRSIAILSVGILVSLFPFAFAIFVQTRHLVAHIAEPPYWATISLGVSIFLLTLVLAYSEPSERWKQWLTVGCLAAFALSFRLVLITLFSTRIESDFADIHNFAVDLATGQGLANVSNYTFIPRVTYVNMTAGFFSIIYRITGPDIRVGKLVMALLSTLSVLMIYLTAKQVSGKHPVGVIAGLLFSFSPALAVFTSLTSPDHIAIFLICLVFAAHSRFLDKDQSHWLKAIFLGSVVGFVDWFRPVGMVLAIAVLIAEWVYSSQHKGKHRVLRQIGISILFFFAFSMVSGLSITISKWLFKTDLPSNTQQLGRFLYIGFNFESGGMYSAADHNLIESTRKEFNGDFSTYNRRLMDLAAARIQSNRAEIPALLFRKIEKVWADSDQLLEFALNGSNDQEIASYLAGLDAQSTLGITLMGLISILSSLRRKAEKPILVMQLFILGVSLLLLITEVQTRYRLVLVPVLVILAADGIMITAVFLKKVTASIPRLLQRSTHTTAQR